MVDMVNFEMFQENRSTLVEMIGKITEVEESGYCNHLEVE